MNKLMKLNGMCPLCYLKKIFGKPAKVTDVIFKEPYGNNVALTPPMGWSSWNTFKNKIDENLILETGAALRDKGLCEAGYRFLNFDDNWQSSIRDKNGELQADFSKFPSGMPSVVKDLNAMGLSVGIYSSNGTHTCEDLPASLGREDIDAYTFAKWGIEYFKYDFCHNIKISKYAPLVYGISIAPLNKHETQSLPISDAILYGMAKLMPNKRVPGNKIVTGLDEGLGKAEFNNVYAEEDGEYVLTLNILKKGAKYEKFMLVEVGGSDYYYFYIPTQKFWNYTARFQQIVKLKKGVNTVVIMNPVSSKADSAMLQYTYMGKAAKMATERVATERKVTEKPIIFSICEWGWNHPWQWGRAAGNLWRISGDIRPIWIWINHIYEKNVKLYSYAAPGAWNDPDMLEVGNGKLTDAQNKTHFSLWCMMSSPLILGNDVRKITPEILNIVTNKSLIAINQDPLGKQAKRIVKGFCDILARPLADGSTAVLFYNRSLSTLSPSIDISLLVTDEYVKTTKKEQYTATEIWSDETITLTDKLCVGKLEKDAVKVYIIK